MKPKIILAGGTGYIGKILIKKFSPDYEIIVLSRKGYGPHKQATYLKWDGCSFGSWVNELENAAAVINLAGKSVNCRYSDRNKEEIVSSRVNATLVIGNAIQNCVVPPKVWINAGSAAVFGDSGEEVKIETSGTGSGFSADVCRQWEEAFYAVPCPDTRKVFLRIGLIFGKDSWVLKPFITMVRLGLGGTIGSGEQYVSWICEEDFLTLTEQVLTQSGYGGTIHAVSPNPVTNKEFMALLRHIYAAPFGIPHPAFLVKAGAPLIGTEAELALSGRRVVSRVLEEKKFSYKYPHLKEALELIAKKN